ncbi:hypothetical protein ACQCVP_17875 [Rossellomorea vietnamensis]|uniref:hypothetical protein n=1 Tax=Rossellomorea vietnamensis TaxID=218284 RepID=UPI003CEEBE8D
MNKKKKIYILSGIVMVLVLSFIYLSYFSVPSSFPSDKQLIEEMNQRFPETNAEQIQEVFTISEKHKYVAYRSNGGSYGKSFWVWNKYKWDLVYVGTTGEPRIWKVDKKNPSTYHIVWNIHPEDKLKQLSFYMIRDRGYSITDGVKEIYHPRVQMNETVLLEENNFGVLKIPAEWASFVKSVNDTQSVNQSPMDSFLNQMSADQLISYGWNPYEQGNRETFPRKSVNGSGYSNGEIELDYMMILNENEIERSIE